MARGPLIEEEVGHYHREGYVMVRSMFSNSEISLLRSAAKDDKVLDDHGYGRADGEGGVVRLALWNHPGNGIYGMIARCRSIVDSCEKLLGGEVYHYHSKMVMKEPRIGGAWTWHQDYGYWYQNGVLFPLLTSVFIAVDRATRENGCLQIIPHSHELGRIEHVLAGDQAGADNERVTEVLKVLPLVYIEMEPGDTLFFHPNLLHRSDQNRSETPRWSMICCYNAARNNPYKESHHPRYTPLLKVEDAAILEAGLRRFAEDSSNVSWLDPNRDFSAASLVDRPKPGPGAVTDPPPDKVP